MSYEIETLKSIEIAAEAGNELGQNKSGSATYTTVRFIEAEAGRQTEMLANSISHQKKFDRTNAVVGRKRSSLNISTYLYGAGTPLSATIAPGSGPDYAQMLHTIVGGRYAQSGSAVDSATNGGSFDVIAGTGAQFKAGEIVGRVNTSGKLEARVIKEVSTDSLVLHSRFSETPSSGDNIYGSYTYYLQQNPTGSMQALVRGAESDDVFILTGLQGGFGFSLELGQIPTIQFQMEGASWFSGAAGAAGRQSYSTDVPPYFSDSDVQLYALGSFPIDASSTPLTSISVTPNIGWTEVMGAHGVSNIIDKVMSAVDAENGAATAQLTLYYEDLTLTEAMEQVTEYGLLIQIGSVPGRTVCIAIPRMQITEVTRGEAGGIVGQTVTLVANHDSYSVPSSGFTELAESPFKIALL